MKYKNIKVNVGADPEFFFFDKNEDGTHNLIPADKLLPGKDAPLELPRGTAFFDGVQAEINPQQSTCRESFVYNTQCVLKNIHNKYSSKFKNLRFIPYPSVNVDLRKLRGCDNECFRFGCAPDNCIYDEQRDIKYPDGKKFHNRFAGGHIHIGFSSTESMKLLKDPISIENIIKTMDLFAGIVSIPFTNNDREKVRRKWYGQAGTYRIQPHGLEYRVLSNFWLTSPQLASLFTGIVRLSVNAVAGGAYDDLFDAVSHDEVRKAINTFDITKSKDIWETVIKDYFPRDRRNLITFHNPLIAPGVRDYIDDVFNRGYEPYFKPELMCDYWRINSNLYRFGGRLGIIWFVKEILKNETERKKYIELEE